MFKDNLTKTNLQIAAQFNNAIKITLKQERMKFLR